MQFLKKVFGLIVFWVAINACETKSKTETKTPLEFCVIEYDIPFSASKADEKSGLQGFYINIGEAIAKELGMAPKPSFVMSAFMNRPVREGLMARQCDVQIGLMRTKGKWLIPKKVQLTNAFAELGYALVLPQNSTIKTANDLKGKKVATQTGSPAHIGLDLVGDIHFTFFQFAEPALKALADGKVDAAMIWGPTAGYQNKYHYDNRFKVLPTNYSWPMAIALNAKSDSLAKKVDVALEKIRPTIQKLYLKYGFPTGEIFKMPEIPYTKPTGDDDDDDDD
jgi:polar amino acid transport system substrate-binding protein